LNIKSKKIRFLLLVLSIFLFQGCIEIVERIDVNEDKSGSINLSVSVLQGNLLWGLIQLGGDFEVLDDIEGYARMAEYSLLQSEGIKNVKVTRDIRKRQVGLSFDFDNHRQLNRALYEVAGQTKTIFKPYVYKVKARSVKKKNMTSLIKMLLDEEELEIMPAFINYTTEINLPRPAKSTSGKKATLHQNNQTVRVRGNLADILENKTNTGIRVRY
jgi:hypothetical protein